MDNPEIKNQEQPKDFYWYRDLLIQASVKLGSFTVLGDADSSIILLTVDSFDKLTVNIDVNGSNQWRSFYADFGHPFGFNGIPGWLTELHVTGNEKKGTLTSPVTTYDDGISRRIIFTHESKPGKFEQHLIVEEVKPEEEI